MSEENRLYLYPVWLRIWHGINALGIILLIISGISMQYSTSTYIIMKFETAINMHNFSGVTVSISYFVFFFGNLLTKNKKYYRIKPKGFIKRLVKQARYYMLGMFKNEKSPYPVSEKRKFNPLQKYSYVAIMYLLVPIVIITGIALLFPELIIDEVYSLSGVMLTALLHGIIGFFIFIFLLIHLYVASIGKSPLNNYRGIVTGWHS